jgi:hypothetical protein
MTDNLNYDAIFYAENGAKGEFEFHGDNGVLAREHIEQISQHLKSDINFWGNIKWDKTPDKLASTFFKSKKASNWRSILLER